MPSDPAPMECPSDDVLGAHVQRALDAEAAAQVTSHLDACGACQALVIAAVRGGLAAASPVPTFPGGTPTVPSTSRARTASPEPGSRLGRYELRGVLGAGGMGVVYDAYDGELQRAIALKVLRPELVDPSTQLADRLIRESRLTAKVVHPAVITVFDVGREGERVFIAMELVRGQTLAAHLAAPASAGLSWREISLLVERAGAGLAAAHAAGIVHRDFKPENVLVDRDADRIVVTDFGIARALVDAPDARGEAAPTGANVRLTATGAAIGTPAYMAPEQLAGGDVDHRADVFSFAGVLWEALFGQRPFPGRTVDEIRAAMARPPVIPAGARRVPARLVRALGRGLAEQPRDRWPTLAALLAELAAVRAARARRSALLGATLALGVGVAGAAVVLRPAPATDPCQRALAGFDAVTAPAAAAIVAGLIAGTPQATAVTTRLAAIEGAWRTTHLATCHVDRDVPQDASVTACLDARRTELTSFYEAALVGDATARRFAPRLLPTVKDPAVCAHPASGHLFAAAPDAPALRRQVTALRYRAFEIEDLRDAADYARALPAARQLAVDAASVWPPVAAETLYLLGATEGQGGDSKHAISTLQEAAAVAGRAHHDYIAANAWIQLVLSLSFDTGDPARALEYVTYAEAAAERVGRPAAMMTMLAYVKGSALVEADRGAEAEVALREAVRLAETSAPEYLAEAIQGLGYLYEEQGRYADAVAAYRQAITRLPRDAHGRYVSSPVFFERLAINLSLVGQLAEAEAEARRAVEIAERTLAEGQLGRPVSRANLAQVLQTAGRYEDALVEARRAADEIGKTQGPRSERYGEVLSLEGNILIDLDRSAEAEPVLARACDVIAFTSGEDGSAYAQCQQGHITALTELGRTREALTQVDQVLAKMIAVHGDQHPEVASALVSRAVISSGAGRHAAAVADLERAIAILTAQQIEPGHQAAARWELARELWATDRPRARRELDRALELFATAAPTWAETRRDAQAWHDAGGKPAGAAHP